MLDGLLDPDYDAPLDHFRKEPEQKSYFN